MESVSAGIEAGRVDRDDALEKCQEGDVRDDEKGSMQAFQVSAVTVQWWLRASCRLRIGHDYADNAARNNSA